MTYNHPTGTGALTLNGCTVTGNTTSGYGAGLSTYGSANLEDCTISGNSANGGGGGLYNSGTTKVTDCTVSGNLGGTGDWWTGELHWHIHAHQHDRRGQYEHVW